MTLTYATLLFFVIIGEIVFGALVYSQKGKIDAKVEKYILKVFGNIHQHERDIDFYQSKVGNAFYFNCHGRYICSLYFQLECCGIYGPTFWNAANIRPSCCAPIHQFSCDLSNAYTVGCMDVCKEEAHEFIKLVGVMALVFGCIELIGFIMACWLSSSIAEDTEQQK